MGKTYFEVIFDFKFGQLLYHHNEDIQINGVIFFIPDKYISNNFLFAEHKKLYKYLLATYFTKYFKHNTIDVSRAILSE